MSGADTPSWVHLLTLMVDGPDPTVRGRLRSEDGTDASRSHFGWTVMAISPFPCSLA